MRFTPPKFNRRDFLKGSVALPLAASAASAAATSAAAAGNLLDDPAIESDFVLVTQGDRVIVVVKHFEAGQGAATGLATLVAEEMNADWNKVEVRFAPADNSRYANLAFGVQGTGGSTAVANSFAQYRKAGAEMRARLVAAAAQQWGVSAQEVAVENGVLSAAGQRATFGEMVAAAQAMPPPAQEAVLKKPAQFSHIGKADLPRKDLAGKVNGSAVFAMDKLPDNALFVVVLRAPKFGAVLQSFDESAAAAVHGYVGARRIGNAVAVYAETLWGAVKARGAIQAAWDFAEAETRSSAQMLADYRAAIAEQGIVATDTGNAAAALQQAARTVEAEFVFPFLAHAPMEPLNCVMQREGDGVTVWDGCQMPGLVQGAVAAVLNLAPEKVNIITTYAGGTFGRRATPAADYQTEAAMALAASPQPQRAVKVVWTREDDIQGGYYRPMYVHAAKAGLDADGNIAVWRHRLAGKSLLIGTPFEGFAVNEQGLDGSSVGGIADLSYAVPNFYVDVRNMQTPVTVLWWRSVEHTHTAYAAEVMMDMLAEAAGEDAVAFRLRHLQEKPRHMGVLRAVAQAAGWGKPLPAGQFRGVAVHESFGSFVAEVVQIRMVGDAVKVEKVFCAVDCGIAVNPDIVRAQMESGVGYALGAVMRNQITFGEGGVVEQTNFPNYEPLRMKDMPAVETVIVPSQEPPTGVGEPGVPPLGPALANALYAATGKRHTKLPLTADGVRFT